MGELQPSLIALEIQGSLPSEGIFVAWEGQRDCHTHSGG